MPDRSKIAGIIFLMAGNVRNQDNTRNGKTASFVKPFARNKKGAQPDAFSS
jgi:hypothetical protein